MLGELVLEAAGLAFAGAALWTLTALVAIPVRRMASSSGCDRALTISVSSGVPARQHVVDVVSLDHQRLRGHVDDPVRRHFELQILPVYDFHGLLLGLAESQRLRRLAAPKSGWKSLRLSKSWSL